MALDPLEPPPGWVIIAGGPKNPQGVRIEDHYIHHCPTTNLCKHCQEGTVYCETCRAGSWALTIHCIGRRITQDEARMVVNDELEFIRDKGWVPVNPMEEA